MVLGEGPSVANLIIEVIPMFDATPGTYVTDTRRLGEEASF
jgi:hypothetical protein